MRIAERAKNFENNRNMEQGSLNHLMQRIANLQVAVQAIQQENVSL